MSDIQFQECEPPVYLGLPSQEVARCLDLWGAVFESALSDLAAEVKEWHERDAWARRSRKQAIGPAELSCPTWQWILCDGKAMSSFRSLCQLFGLDPCAVRRALYRRHFQS